MTKYVVSRSAERLDWAHSVVLPSLDALAALKRDGGPTLLIQGSSNLIQSLLAAEMIDEFRLLVFPVLLGTGKKLFGDGTVPMSLELVKSAMSTTGVVIATYLPAGPVRTGSFAFAEPSPAELARRERMKRDG